MKSNFLILATAFIMLSLISCQKNEGVPKEVVNETYEVSTRNDVQCDNSLCEDLSDTQEICIKSGWPYLQEGDGNTYEICFEGTIDMLCGDGSYIPDSGCPVINTLCCVTLNTEDPCGSLTIPVYPGHSIEDTWCTNNITINRNGMPIYFSTIQDLVSGYTTGNGFIKTPDGTYIDNPDQATICDCNLTSNYKFFVIN